MNALPTSAWTPHLGALLLAAGLSAAGSVLLHAPGTLPYLDYYRARLDAGFARVLQPGHGLRVVRYQLGLCILVSLLAGVTGKPRWLLACCLIGMLPGLLLKRAVEQRKLRVEAQLDAWLMGLTSALRAAPALGEAIGSTVPLVQGPMREELEVVLRKFQLGTPLDESLKEMARRVGSPALAAAVSTLSIARRSGGDVAETLETSASVLREMARLEGIVQTQTASGRAQATAVSLVPIPLVAALHYADPSFLAPLFDTALGNAIGAVAITLWCAAGVWARKIVQVDL